MKILVVDDTTSLRMLLKKYLEEEGFEVREAENGKQALELIAEERPDLILLDVLMPVMDGIECCRALKGNVSTEKIPIIMMTAQIKSEHKQAAFLAGSDSFLSKPINKINLIGKLRLLCKLHCDYNGS